jgi:uncharacterized protein (TIGR03083 family)
MTDSLRDPVAELQAMIAELEGEEPPHDLADRLSGVALSERAPGRPLNEPEWVPARDVFSWSVRAFANLLQDLSGHEWTKPTIRGLDVQGLVGHLVGVEHDFQRALHSSSDSVVASASHVDSTEPFVAAQAAASTQETHRRWQEAADTTLRLLNDEDPRRQVSMHGLVLDLEQMLVVRAFELWTHEEDIRRATGRELAPPPATSLQRMVDLSTQFLPFVIGDLDAPVRLVLLGDAGGTFEIDAVKSGAAPCATVVADAIGFCRLVANRMSPSSVATSVTGDQGAAERLLERATSLALD